MKVPFSGPIDSGHYHRPEVIDLTHIDDVPPAIDWVTKELLHGDEALPDAMVINFSNDRLRD